MTSIRTRQWQQQRTNWQHRINQGGICCWRCGDPIPPHKPAAWDLGHRVDRHRGGNNTNVHPEHSTTCNRAAGGQLGAAITNSPPPLPSRAP